MLFWLICRHARFLSCVTAFWVQTPIQSFVRKVETTSIDEGGYSAFSEHKTVAVGAEHHMVSRETAHAEVAAVSIDAHVLQTGRLGIAQKTVAVAEMDIEGLHVEHPVVKRKAGNGLGCVSIVVLRCANAHQLQLESPGNTPLANVRLHGITLGWGIRGTGITLRHHPQAVDVAVVRKLLTAA